MNAIKFLYAAYIVTWLIHALYLGSLVRRYKSLQKQLKELGKLNGASGFGIRASTSVHRRPLRSCRPHTADRTSRAQAGNQT
jgi:CcmD family protein